MLYWWVNSLLMGSCFIGGLMFYWWVLLYWWVNVLLVGLCSISGLMLYWWANVILVG